MSQFSRTVKSPSEYKEAKRHAEALGFELREVCPIGSWDTANGEPVFPGHSTHIEKAGRKYFYMELTTEDGSDVFKVQPTKGASGIGKLSLKFTDN